MGVTIKMKYFTPKPKTEEVQNTLQIIESKLKLNKRMAFMCAGAYLLFRGGEMLGANLLNAGLQKNTLMVIPLLGIHFAVIIILALGLLIALFNYVQMRKLKKSLE